MCRDCHFSSSSHKHLPKHVPSCNCCVHRGTPGALNGCLNDVACLRHLLTSRFGYLDSDITVLRDDVDPEHWPTRVNMLEHMHALLAHQAVGDSFFFSFSGEVTADV